MTLNDKGNTVELAQVRLLVTDFAACYRFYADVLGLKPQSGAADGPYEKFRATIGAAGVARQDRAMMAEVLVDDLDAYCEQIPARGAVLLHGPAPMTERMRVAHLKDPEGNLVELQEWL